MTGIQGFSGDSDVAVLLLEGDATGSSRVTSADLNKLKSLAGQVSGANFLSDVNLDGVVDDHDGDLTKANTRALSPACP